MPSHAEISPLLKPLESVAAALNAATGEMNDYFAQMVAGLEELDLGVMTWVPLEHVQDPGYEVYFDLGYASGPDGTWDLFVRTSTKDDPEGTLTPLRHVSRGRRIQALSELPQLVTAIAEQAAELRLKIERELRGAK